MTKKEFLQTQDCTQLKTINQVIAILESYPFINIKYSGEELPSVNISTSFNYTVGFNITTNIIKHITHKIANEVKKHTKALNPCVMDGLLEKSLKEHINFDNNQTIITNYLLGSQLYESHPSIETYKDTERVSCYNIGKIGLTNIFIDPYQKYTDRKLFVIQPGAVTIKIGKLMDINPNNNIMVNNRYDVILNPELVEEISVDITELSLI